MSPPRAAPAAARPCDGAPLPRARASRTRHPLCPPRALCPPCFWRPRAGLQKQAQGGTCRAATMILSGGPQAAARAHVRVRRALRRRPGGVLRHRRCAVQGASRLRRLAGGRFPRAHCSARAACARAAVAPRAFLTSCVYESAPPAALQPGPGGGSALERSTATTRQHCCDPTWAPLLSRRAHGAL